MSKPVAMMGERDYVLPTNTVRNLNDKLYEKRKAAALEIERMVKGMGGGGADDFATGVVVSRCLNCLMI